MLHNIYFNTKLIFFVSLSLFVLFLFVIPSSRASALSGSEFNAGRIIDDSVFYNENTMSAGQIQSFLNAKVPSCDTDGSELHAGTTRAQYGASRGYPAPYTCLKDYSQNIPTITNGGSDLCKKSISGGTKTAAQIIYDVSQACGINPQVMIVLLQKEQSLITDDWPWEIQYRSATGYGCPDTAPCDSEYYGFFNQVYQAAKAFRRYEANPASYNYRAGRNNNVYFHPDLSRCGSSNVFIENQATANLYIYTPYQPNQAALNNLYGTGDSCSAYGNRNFWRMFNDWFGGTLNYAYDAEMQSVTLYSDISRTNEINSTTLRPGDPVYVTVKVRNAGGRTWENSFVRVGTRSPRNHSSFIADNTWLSSARPASLKEASIIPGAVGTFEFSFTAPTSDGSYLEKFQIVAEGKAWMEFRSRFDLPFTVSSPYNAKIVSIKTYSDNAYESRIGSTVQTEDRIYWRVMAKNTGSNTWDNSIVKVGTEDPKNRVSVFADSDWPSAARPALLKESSVAPGEVGTFEFSTLASSLDDGVYQESFRLLAEGHSWMPASNFTQNIKVSENISTLVNSESLVEGTELRGSNRLVMQGDGNLVIYNGDGRALWSSGTRAPGSNRLVMQGDGNLVIYNGDGRALWSSGTRAPGSNRLVMQGDGNLVIYNGDGRALWSSGTRNK